MSSRHLLIVLFIALLPTAASADWQLVPDQSSLSFVSIKKGKVAEVHHFGRLSGGIDARHRFTLRIDLASVATGIPVRDERMRKLLFETARFPVATVSGSLPDDRYDHMAPGEAANATVQARLALHGQTQTLSARLVVVGLAGNQLLVTTRDPVIVDAADFRLLGGIEKLREVAKLPAIATAVPVNFVLVFERRPQEK